MVRHVMGALQRGVGGWISTPNVDILRRAAYDEQVRALLGGADLVVADGAPVVWAARLSGQPLPERVAGSSLLWSLSTALAGHAGRIFLLGGAPGVPERAGAALSRYAPGLVVAGALSPPWGFETDRRLVEEIRARVVDAAPDLVFVGLGCPKQERLIAELAPALPSVWWVGCGAALDFAAGQLRRAPRWMQASGLEWLHRMMRDPRRLARRYLVDDAPYTLRLLAGTAAARMLTPATPR